MRIIKRNYKKIFMVILAIIIFILSFSYKIASILGLNSMNNFALQSSTNKTLITMNEVNKEIINVAYINKEGKVENRPIKIYKPKSITGLIPLVYIPHYAVDEGSLEWQTYLSNGWAVASPDEFKHEYNGLLVSDDLVFNNAALYTLKGYKDIDKEKIAIVGGSAGGYMTLMLDGLQLGIVASIANSPVTNVYFNLHEYFPMVNKINKNWKIFDIPVPYVALVGRSFLKNLEYLDGGVGVDKYEALSPIGLAKAYSSPIVINHNTSDVLVPVDSVSKKYTYKNHDGTLPDYFSAVIPENYPGILSHSLEEELAKEKVSLIKYDYEKLNLEQQLPYRSEVQFSINIIDDGLVSGRNGHGQMSVKERKVLLYDDYLKLMFEKGIGNTENLTGAKLLLLLDRYLGESKQLPAHIGIDDKVYGSLEIYKQEIIEEFKLYTKYHSIEEVDKILINESKNLTREKIEKYNDVWKNIKSEINKN